MKKITYFSFFIIVLLGNIFAQKNEIYVATIEGDIDLGLAPFVKRVIEEAERNSADAVVFKINTFGGRVDAATQIKDAILNSKINTIAFVDKRAISAGALISLSCVNIAMVPGASIGASTVVDQTGNKVSEKHQSYMRSEMRATAEKNGRPTNIAEAMVDERVVVEGLVDSTQLVTLTSKEAVKYGIADTVASSLTEALSAFGYENVELVELEENWAEDFIRFLNNPVISSLLIMVGLLGMFTEIKTPGWGLPGTASVIALALFFGAGYILELASAIEIILFVIGVALLLVEVFMMPGFGVAGILGIICVIGSLFLGLISDFPLVDWDIINEAIFQLAATLVLTLVMFYFLTKLLPQTDIWNRLILQDDIHEQSGYTSKPIVHDLLGAEGSAYTDLRPAGTAIINGKRYDVVTEGDYVMQGSEIEVIQVEGSRVVVEKKS